MTYKSWDDAAKDGYGFDTERGMAYRDVPQVSFLEGGRIFIPFTKIEELNKHIAFLKLRKQHWAEKGFKQPIYSMDTPND